MQRRLFDGLASAHRPRGHHSHRRRRCNRDTWDDRAPGRVASGDLRRIAPLRLLRRQGARTDQRPRRAEHLVRGACERSDITCFSGHDHDGSRERGSHTRFVLWCVRLRLDGVERDSVTDAFVAHPEPDTDPGSDHAAHHSPHDTAYDQSSAPADHHSHDDARRVRVLSHIGTSNMADASIVCRAR